MGLSNELTLDDYALFNGDKSRWIDTESPTINDADITQASPDVVLLKKTVKIKVVLPNFKGLLIEVSSKDKVRKVIKYICDTIGITDRHEEYSLIDNFQVSIILSLYNI